MTSDLTSVTAALLADYVVPYWPWILLGLIGLIVLRSFIRRAMGLIWILVALGAFSGVGLTGVMTWAGDRGWVDWWPLQGLGLT